MWNCYLLPHCQCLKQNDSTTTYILNMIPDVELLSAAALLMYLLPHCECLKQNDSTTTYILNMIPNVELLSAAALSMFKAERFYNNAYYIKHDS